MCDGSQEEAVHGFCLVESDKSPGHPKLCCNTVTKYANQANLSFYEVFDSDVSFSVFVQFLNDSQC